MIKTAKHKEAKYIDNIMMENASLTIFTPTYNRAYILSQLYDSLIGQTVKYFEWLIVDDGSVDETENLVASWIESGQITIRYIKQANGGKMRAHNRGVVETNTELFLCVDSDDWLPKNAVEMILNHWQYSSCKDDEHCCGMVAYRGKNDVEPIGNVFPHSIETATLSGLYQQGFRGDTSLIFKTSVIRQYPFPIIGNEKFITEAYVYDQIDLKYSLQLLREIIIVCEYREDGLTQNLTAVSFRNPCGYSAYFIQKGNLASAYHAKFAFYIRANCFRKETRKVVMPLQANNLLLYNLAYPFGLMLRIKKVLERLRRD